MFYYDYGYLTALKIRQKASREELVGKIGYFTEKLEVDLRVILKCLKTYIRSDILKNYFSIFKTLLGGPTCVHYFLCNTIPQKKTAHYACRFTREPYFAAKSICDIVLFLFVS